MRDDVKNSIAELTHSYREKLDAVKKLLLSESDKLHYLKSQNFEQIFDLLEADKAIIASIDLVDYDISRIESSLAAAMGLHGGGIFSQFAGGGDEIKEVLSLRNDLREAIARLYGRRRLLTEGMKTESRRLRDSINDLIRIGKLSGPGLTDGGS